MSDVEKRKRGRPATGVEVRRNDFHLRMTDSELEMLRFVCEKEGKSMNSVLVEAVRTKYNLAKFL